MARRSTTLKFLRPLKAAAERVLGWLIVGTLSLLRRIDRRRMAKFTGRLMRLIGPWFPEHKVGRDNLRAAFPDKPPGEIEKILGGVWENLGRVAAEFAHIDRIVIEDLGRPERTPAPDVTIDRTTYQRLTT